MTRLAVRKTGGKGNGVFAVSPIAKGTRLLDFKGPMVEAKDVPFPLRPEEDQFLQIGPGLFLGPTNDIDNTVNHSCRPNTAVGFDYYRAFLVALRDIEPGEELTFDYSVTSTDSTLIWSMECRCGDSECRGLISGFQTLPSAVQAKYLALGVVPQYVIDRALKDWTG